MTRQSFESTLNERTGAQKQRLELTAHQRVTAACQSGVVIGPVSAMETRGTSTWSPSPQISYVKRSESSSAARSAASCSPPSEPPFRPQLREHLSDALCDAVADPAGNRLANSLLPLLR